MGLIEMLQNLLTIADPAEQMTAMENVIENVKAVQTDLATKITENKNLIAKNQELFLKVTAKEEEKETENEEKELEFDDLFNEKGGLI